VEPFAVIGGVIVLVLVILGIILLPLKDVIADARVVAADAKNLGAAVRVRIW